MKPGITAPGSSSGTTHRAAPRRILVIQLRRLGDVILATGILEDLRRAFPDAALDFLTGEVSARVLQHHPLIDELMVYDRAHHWREAMRLRRRRYDWVIDGQGSPTTSRLAWLTGAHVRVGWAVRVWRHWYTHTVPRSGLEMVYVVRERQRFLEMLGVPIGPPRTRLAVLPSELAAAEHALLSAGVGPSPRVALVLSVSEPIREWPAERYAELAKRLLGSGVSPVLLENPGDAGKVERFRAAAPDVPVVQTFDPRLLLGALASCDALVSGDTGPAHMATALGVPRLTLYGPTDPVQWNPALPTTPRLVDPAFRVMTARERGRAGAHPGLTGIAVDDVYDEVLRLLHRSEAVGVSPSP